MSRIKTLLFVLALAAQVPLASATVTYAVGTCEPKLPSFTTIQGALSGTPAPKVVTICPGTYAEQVVITFPVTVEGISDGNLTGATIVAPPGGLASSCENFAAQVCVDSVNGEVNLSNLTVDGSGINTSGFYAGVMYHGSAGTANHLTIENQEGNTGLGFWDLQGASSLSVTIENSSLQNFGAAGITTLFGSGNGTLTVKQNFLSTSSQAAAMNPEADSLFVSDNLIASSYGGINVNANEGSVSKNTVVGSEYFGIAATGAVSVTSNTIYNMPTGMLVGSDTETVAGNFIVATENAINLSCIPGDYLHSNTILGAANGLINVPTGAASTNTYYNVGTISSGGC
jgi:hypothetical protein